MAESPGFLIINKGETGALSKEGEAVGHGKRQGRPVRTDTQVGRTLSNTGLTQFPSLSPQVMSTGWASSGALDRAGP